jgi:predicted AAA+ superfamily ATPase
MSINEISRLLMVDNKTVAKYIDLLEKTYVVFFLPAFSGNARKDIRKNRKIYFYDLGIRNAVLGNFVPIESRSDIGALWENYLIVERIKSFCKLSFPPRNFFWRNIDQREVDYLEETAEQLSAWEFKWNPLSKAKIPLAFHNAYPNAITSIVTPDNYDDFLMSEITTNGKTT